LIKFPLKVVDSQRPDLTVLAYGCELANT